MLTCLIEQNNDYHRVPREMTLSIFGRVIMQSKCCWRDRCTSQCILSRQGKGSQSKQQSGGHGSHGSRVIFRTGPSNQKVRLFSSQAFERDLIHATFDKQIQVLQ